MEVEDECPLPRIDIWMTQSLGIFAFSEMDVKSGRLRVGVRAEDI